MSDFVWLGVGGFTLAALLGAAFAFWRLVSRNFELSLRLKQATEMLRHAENLGKIGTWTIDVADQRVHWSDRVFEIHGRPIGFREPPLADAIAYYHPDDQPVIAAMVDRAIQDGAAFEFTARLITESGLEKNVLTRGLCSLNAQGGVDRVFGVFIEASHVIQLADFVNDNNGQSAHGDRTHERNPTAIRHFE